MPSIRKLVVTLNGGPITGPAVNVTYWADGATTGPAAMSAFWAAAATFMPSGITIEVPGTGDTVDEGSSQIDGTWVASGGSTITTSGGTDPFPAGVGGRTSYFSDGIVDGRRVRGSIFVVPIIGTSYQADGTLSTTIKNALNTMATTLAGVTGFGVYTRHRPAGPADPTHPLGNPPERDGSFHDVLAGVAPDKVSWLRSRRT